MDFPRSTQRSRRKPIIAGAVGLAIAGTAFGIRRLEPAAPELDLASVRIAEVTRGPLLRTARGMGKLVPRHIVWITAPSAGRVEQILLRPGASLRTGTEILSLDNPDVHLQMLDADRQLAVALADLKTAESELETDLLSRQANLSSLRAEYADADRRRAAARALYGSGAVSEIDAQLAEERAGDLAARLDLEKGQLDLLATGGRDRVRAQRQEIEKLRAIMRFRREQIERMHVRAPEPGLLQELPLELGQWVTPGTVLAKVARPGDLRAELQIPEILAKDLAAGLSADIDLRTAHVPGHVTRVAPAARDGTVLVEVDLDDAPPAGARPDLAVDGTIALERISNVLFVSRPFGVEPGSVAMLYRLEKDTSVATQVRVQFGRASLSEIEIQDGLAQGDRVVISDTHGTDGANRITLR